MFNIVFPAIFGRKISEDLFVDVPVSCTLVRSRTSVTAKRKVTCTVHVTDVENTMKYIVTLYRLK